VHYPIKSFYRAGTITSDTFVKARERIVKDVEDEMRDAGYVPVLDFPVQFSRQYNLETEDFSFEITVCGAYIGEDESWLIGGITNGSKVPKFTQPPK
jgi:hypothetical protein